MITLGLLSMRARGVNLQDGMVSAWTTLEFTDSDSFRTTGDVSDFSIEFWTVYENSCYSLSSDGCDTRDGERAGAEAEAYTLRVAASEAWLCLDAPIGSQPPPTQPPAQPQPQAASC